jgi:uncharacterized repeat protein (TIGR03803 family)
MVCNRPTLRGARSCATALLLLTCGAAYGTDTYNIASRQLSIPSVAIGAATYSNVLVTVGAIISGPSGSTPKGSEDRYDPGNNQLTVQSVTVGAATFHNVVVTVAGLLSIGSVSGADSYNGVDLGISLVEVGVNFFRDVHVGVGQVIRVAGGMPTLGPDTYDSASNELAIPAVQVGSHVYTNVVVSVGHLVSVGGLSSTLQQSNFYSFTGGIYGISGSQDGDDPVDSLIQTSDHNFYGTTAGGGANGPGTVFKISPTATETVLYSFTYGAIFGSTDGANPTSCLILGHDGNFYGTTRDGGTLGAGTVFSISASGTESILYSFGTNGGLDPGADAGGPATCLVEGADRNFYGTTQTGGANQRGTVFRVTPAGVETILHSFGGDGGIAGSFDGAAPIAALVLGADGNFYGTTSTGGAHNVGTVFQITPAGTVTVVHSFSGGTAGTFGNIASGANPSASVIIGSDGNFYGTTLYGGAYLEGAVFKVTPAGVETLLHSFAGNDGITGSTDGAWPTAGLVEGSDGNFYGTTTAGGAYYREGCVFKVTPTGVETVLHSFSGLGAIPNSTDGVNPRAALIQATDGNFYGTTGLGGVYNGGTIFKMTGVIPSQ